MLNLILIDEMNEMLKEIADEIPEPFYAHLNGGVILSPKTVLHDDDVDGSLFTLGEYHHDNMGRYIVLYYGSFRETCAGMSRKTLYRKLKKTLLHEFTHHIESLAGERGLERRDAIEIAKYRRKMGL
ncbi:MAG: metallopeptidase family protein [Oscillospiraceae bacterium]|nr:metallopeptidase family protein [Oscillospiraceae bacterium]